MAQDPALAAQTDAKQADTAASNQRAFDSFVKDHALKILLDYSASTKRKWKAIRDEIMQLASAKPSRNAPLLTRQDLESWARGESVLGDEKFRHVFEFLTHRDTLARPEFAHASVLKEPFHNLLRIGRAMAEFYSDFANSIWLGKPDIYRPGLSAEEIDRRAEALCGIYAGEYRGQKICLSLERLPNEAFFVAHYLVFSGELFDPLDDWNLNRHSGYATVGQAVTIHLKGVLLNHTRTLRVLPPRIEDPPDNLRVLSDELIAKSLEIIMWDTMETLRKTLPYVNPFDYYTTLNRSDDARLHDLIQHFRWRIPG